MIKKILAMPVLTLLILLALLSCTQKHQIYFHKPPCLYPYHGYHFMICEDFTFEVDAIRFTIPKGFTTDLASIPRPLWSIYSPAKTETIAAAIVHDWFYSCPHTLTRREVDAIFFDGLVKSNVKQRTAFQYWCAVRLFGRFHFNKGDVCTYVNTRENYRQSILSMAFPAVPYRG